MPNGPLILSAANRVDGLDVHVHGFIRPRHHRRTNVGSEPLEDGTEVNDHAAGAPRELDLVGYLSDFDGVQRVIDAWAEIDRLWDAIEIVRVTTEWQIYDEMIIVNVEGGPEGRGGQCDIRFREIKRVTVAELPIPPAALSGVAANRPGAINRGRVFDATDPDDPNFQAARRISLRNRTIDGAQGDFVIDTPGDVPSRPDSLTQSIPDIRDSLPPGVRYEFVMEIVRASGGRRRFDDVVAQLAGIARSGTGDLDLEEATRRARAATIQIQATEREQRLFQAGQYNRRASDADNPYMVSLEDQQAVYEN